MIEQNTNDLVIIQITDSHLLETEKSLFLGVNPEQHFQQILQLILEQQPQIDYILHTGDIAQEPSPEVYQRYLKNMQMLEIPFNHTLGNHDDPLCFPFLSHQNDEICIINLEHWQIILLNSAVVGRVDGEISQKQLQELKEQLLKSNKNTLIALHHHPILMQSEWLDHHRLKNNNEFLQILAEFPQVKACIFGHVHQDFYAQWKHIHFYATPAISVQFKPKNQEFSLDNTAPAYRSLVLKENGSFHTQIHYLAEFQSIDESADGY